MWIQTKASNTEADMQCVTLNDPHRTKTCLFTFLRSVLRVRASCVEPYVITNMAEGKRSGYTGLL